MKERKLFTRREVIATGLTSVGALFLPGCSRELPPTYGNILRMGDVFTYAAQRTLLPGQSMAKEYQFGDITSFPATGTTNPAENKRRKPSEEYGRLLKGGFIDWHLSIEGRVARPGTYSLAHIQKLPSRTQITRHTCEEGWAAIAQ